jgi:hypothetical protein
MTSVKPPKGSSGSVQRVGIYTGSLVPARMIGVVCRWIVAAATAPRCFVHFVAGAFVAFH